MTKNALLVLFTALLPLAVFAQTEVGGIISSNTLWQAAQGPYVVTNDLQLQNGATLTIEAGTTVYMAANTSILVQAGTVSAVGTAQAPIRITSDKQRNNQTPLPGDWRQIVFNAGTNKSTKLEHVQIEYGKGILVNGAALTFNYLTIRNNQGPAISSDLAASTTGVGNVATGNNLNAIILPDGDIGNGVTWGLRGIPYLVLAGSVSVGTSPKITSVSPNTLQQGENQTVTLSGTRLSGFSQPTFTRSGLTAQVLPGATESQVQLQLSATSDAEVGFVSLSAITDAGEVKFNNALTVLDIQPKLASVTPSMLSTHQGDSLVVLKGQNFTPQSIAYLDVTALATTYVNASEISAIVPNQITSGVRSIKLRTPNPVGGGQEFVSNDLPLSVITPPPVVTAISPGDLRRGETKSFEITGAGLAATQVGTSQATLTVSDLVTTATKVSFKLTAAADAVLGKQQVTLTNAGGSTSASITVNPALPLAKVAPTPLAVPPDSTARQFAVQLSFADTINHSFAVTVGDPTIARTSTATLTIPAGSLQAVGNITGLKNGNTSLTLVSSTLGTLSLPVYVTSDFIGLNTSYAASLGVVLTPPPTQPAQQSVSPVSRNLGVVIGNFIQNMAPRAFSTGSGPSTLTITGGGLEGVASVTINSATGVTVGSVTAAPDGKSATVQLTVASDAPITQRQIIVLSSSGAAYAVATPGADRILITPPMPEIDSIEPIYGVVGTSNLNLIVRGRNLQGAQSLNAAPSDGLTIDSSLVVNADGTQLTAGVAISSSATTGQRVITVTTPAGTSDATAHSANVFTVVNQLVSNVTPIASPVLGVVKQEASVTPSQTQGLFAPALGIAFGSAAVSVSPRAKAIGETFTLTVQGSGLLGVTALSFVPETGVSVGTPMIAADGRSLSVDVTIAADAPQTARTIKLSAGTNSIVFANPGAAIFNVTAVVPSIDSVEPTVLQVGVAPVVMTVRGKNFQNAQSVKIVPSDGLTISIPPTVDAAATQLTVNVSAATGTMLGPRAVIVTTPGGESSANLSVANTVTLANSVATTGPVAAPLLGIVKLEEGNPAPVSTTYGPIVAADLGVVFGEVSVTPPSSSAFSKPLAVVVGSAAIDIHPKQFAVSSSDTLTITGVGLGAASGVTVSPSQGVTVGAPLQVSVDGSQVMVPISIASDAAATTRTVVLSDATGKIVFGNPAGATFGIYPDAIPQFSSISPILSTAGSTLTLTITGQNLQNVAEVVATPADGLTIEPPVVNTNGTQVTVRIQIAPDASLGARVIQVVTPVASSSANPSPANTFTVYAQ